MKKLLLMFAVSFSAFSQSEDIERFECHLNEKKSQYFNESIESVYLNRGMVEFGQTYKIEIVLNSRGTKITLTDCLYFSASTAITCELNAESIKLVKNPEDGFFHVVILSEYEQKIMDSLSKIKELNKSTQASYDKEIDRLNEKLNISRIANKEIAFRIKHSGSDLPVAQMSLKRKAN